MLLLQVIVFTLVDFSSSYKKRQECYGSTYAFTPTRMSTSIYYKPRTSNERILVVQGGKSKHERFEASLWTIKMKDLTEQDDGAILFFDQHDSDSVQLTITDCRAPDTSHYGGVFSWRLPSSAEYMEFAQVVPVDSPLKPLVIWNRTDPSSSRGKIQRNYFEIYDLKQKDSGYYKLRGSKNELLRWKRLRVEENHGDFEQMEGDYFSMDFPVQIQIGSIEFVPKESDIVEIIEESSMRHRMEVTESYFIIRGLKIEDSGTYRFIDDDGFVAMRVQLNVMKGEVPTWAYFVIVSVIVLGILICCCCVKTCCCEGSKRNSSGSTVLATPPVYYHDSNQPAQTTVTLLSRDPRRSTTDATICDTAGVIVDPPSTKATVAGGPGFTSLIANSSDFEPTFELKGSVFSSAPPLSSDTSIQDVYTSDKLNFL